MKFTKTILRASWCFLTWTKYSPLWEFGFPLLCESFAPPLYVRVVIPSPTNSLLPQKLSACRQAMETCLEQLSLSTDEEDELVLESGVGANTEQTHNLCLVGRFHTDRNVNFIATKHRIASIRRPRKGINIPSVNQDTFAFQFFHPIDRQHGPCALGVWQSSPPPSSTSKGGNSICHSPASQTTVGPSLWRTSGFHVRWCGSADREFQRRIPRVRCHQCQRSLETLHALRHPLKRWKKIRTAQGEWSALLFKYDLGTTVTLCRLIGHTEKYCDKLFTQPEGELRREWGRNSMHHHVGPTDWEAKMAARG